MVVFGLVKFSKFGLILDNLEIEVLDCYSFSIDFFKVGWVLFVYFFIEGIIVDFLWKLVLVC